MSNMFAIVRAVVGQLLYLISHLDDGGLIYFVMDMFVRRYGCSPAMHPNVDRNVCMVRWLFWLYQFAIPATTTPERRFGPHLFTAFELARLVNVLMDFFGYAAARLRIECPNEIFIFAERLTRSPWRRNIARANLAQWQEWILITAESRRSSPGHLADPRASGYMELCPVVPSPPRKYKDEWELLPVVFRPYPSRCYSMATSSPAAALVATSLGGTPWVYDSSVRGVAQLPRLPRRVLHEGAPAEQREEERELPEGRKQKHGKAGQSGSLSFLCQWYVACRP